MAVGPSQFSAGGASGAAEWVAEVEGRLDALEAQHPPTTVPPAGPAVTPTGTVVTDPKDSLIYAGDVEFKITANRQICRIAPGTDAVIVDPVTKDVEAICNQSSSTVSQRNSSQNYYRRPIAGPDSVWTQIAATAASAGPLYKAPPPAAPGSVYRANAGRILAPNGQEWRGRGLNAGTMGVNNLNENLDIFRRMANALVETVPGTNLLRAQVWQVAIDSGLTPENLSPMVNVLTSKGVVVELEYHDYPQVISGARLQQVAQWYTRAATVFKPNPMVVFGAQNEPDHGDIDGMNEALYNAVRSASDTLFFWSQTGGWSLQGMNPARYRGMHNVGCDTHLYAWRVHDDVNRGCTVAEAYARYQQIVGEIRNGFPSADGPPPILVGEYGVHGLGGTGFDAGGQQSVAAVQRLLDDGVVQATANWAWRTFNTHGPGMPYIAGDLVIPEWMGGAGSLTQNPAGGQEHANWVAGRGIGFT